MRSPLLVLCLKWGTKYDDDYVLRLQRAVKRHLHTEHEFLCLTDRPVEGVKCLPLPSDLPGWWAKIGLFHPGIPEGTKLYLDLDVVVTGPLEIFIPTEDTDKLWALDDFSYSLVHPRHDIPPETLKLLGGWGTCNSSVMCWTDSAGALVWDRFTPEVMDRLHGDQNWITQVLWPHELRLYPWQSACSYKYSWLLEGRHYGSLMVFHGDPKPHTLERSNPFRVLWERA